MSATIKTKNERIKAETLMFQGMVNDLIENYKFRFGAKTKYHKRVTQRLNDSFKLIKEDIKLKHKVGR